MAFRVVLNKLFMASGRINRELVAGWMKQLPPPAVTLSVCGKLSVEEPVEKSEMSMWVWDKSEKIICSSGWQVDDLCSLLPLFYCTR